MFIDFREREEGRESKRVKHTCPDQGSNLQRFGVWDDPPTT